MRRSERLRRWFFPPEVELPEAARRVVGAVYPTLDLGAVRFHLGIPHVFKILAIQGITLPGRVSPRRTRIYIEPRYWQPASVDGLGLILHEAFHALQLQEAGPGLGLLRPFVILYLAIAAGNRFRYAGHPLEDDAYCLAGDWESRFESSFQGLEVTEEGCACLATSASGLRFWTRLADSVPGWRRVAAGRLPRAARTALLGLLSPWVAGWLLLWTAVIAFLGLLKGLVEGIGAVAVAVLRMANR
ncbi:MAG TPA: hypothetical protein VL025_14505 [Thermoanaerobaculia bacterium]|nr:hypothetical protein [Thermoanaerobaculia bacterium]